MLVVSNSSPLIALSRLAYLNLLNSLYNQILIPQAVYQEVVQAGKGREGVTAVASGSCRVGTAHLAPLAIAT